MKKHRYTYVVLRYQHSAFSGERLNAGVMVTCVDPLFVRIKVRKNWKRFAAAYASFDRHSVKQDFDYLASAAIRFERELNETPLLPCHAVSAAKVLEEMFGPSEGSIVWSREGTGTCTDLEAELEMLFNEFVSRFDAVAEDSRRDDDDVFQALTRELQGTEVMGQMTEHVIRSDKGDVRFKRAFKNGIWHCVQPLSFDLTNDEYIHQKAARWAGNMMAASETDEFFRPYFLLGAPSSAGHERAFRAADALLRSSPGNPIVVREDQSNVVADQLIEAFRSSR